MRTAILTLLTTAALLGGTTQQSQAEIAWESSLRKAHTRASSENKLILLHFVRDNCVYCDKLEEGAFKSAEVNEAVGKNFVPLKINVSESKGNKKLAEMFKVDRFPMDVVVTTEGEALAHGVSPQEPQRYVGMLARTLPAVTPAAPTSPGPTVPQQQIASAVPTGPMPSKIPSGQVPSGAVPGYAAAQAPPAPQPPAAAVQNKLVSAKTNQSGSGMSLSMPEKAAGAVSAYTSKTSSTPPSAASVANEPKLAMDGYCAVSVVNESRWVEGKPDFGVVHLGKLYLFVNEKAMKTFLEDPIPYTPVLNEIDVVRFFEERKIVPGKREWAMQDPSNKRMFFFADEAAMLHFENEYARYVDAAIEVMGKAVKESNPGS